MGSPAMKVGAIDIGTNSMRLLITGSGGEVGRWTEVTGLGRSVDRTGYLSSEGIEESLAALARFARLMVVHGVERRKAIATSAARDASNREHFFDLAAAVLGVRPTLVAGEEEARLALAGATGGVEFEPPVIVSDIGGGSTEFVTADTATSIDIGSVRLTERAIPSRPAPASEVAAARSLVASLFGDLTLDPGTLIGVAGTWTSLAAIAQDLPEYSTEKVHGHRMKRPELHRMVERLSRLSVEETAGLSALDPKRAPVILAGALVAEGVMEALNVGEVVVSEHDSLDGVAMDLLALP